MMLSPSSFSVPAGTFALSKPSTQMVVSSTGGNAPCKIVPGDSLPPLRKTAEDKNPIRISARLRFYPYVQKISPSISNSARLLLYFLAGGGSPPRKGHLHN